MRVFHVATLADWEAAQVSGTYTTSTRGQPLADVGFVHCAQDFQVGSVRERYFADVTEPLVLLTVDTDRLTSPWRLDEVPGSDAPFPHVYGPLDLDAVAEVVPLG